MATATDFNFQYDLNVDQYKLKELPTEIQQLIVERSKSSKASMDVFAVKVLTGSYRAFEANQSWSLLTQENRDVMCTDDPTVTTIKDLVDGGWYFGWAVANCRDMALLLGRISKEDLPKRP